MMEYINNNYTWLSTMVILELTFFTISLVLLKMNKLEPNFGRDTAITAGESTILIAALGYAGAPAWVLISYSVLAVISLAGPAMIKWKYGL